MKDIKIKNLEGSKVEITGELAWDAFAKYEEKAVQTIGENVNVDGFRPGKAPKDMLEGKVGQIAILEEMAHLAFKKIYPEIVKEHKIDALGYPEVNITKLAWDNPLGFTIVSAVYPEVTLADYKKIAKEVNKIVDKADVTDKEVEEAIENIRTMHAKQELYKKMQDGTAPKEDVENNPDESPEEVQKRIDAKLELPEITEEFVKQVGGFESVDEFKKGVRDNIKIQKEQKEGDKVRLDMMEKIIAESKTEVPDILVNSEMQKMMGQMKADIEKMGMKFEDYLKRIEKSEDGIKEEMKADALKRAKMQLIIANIAKEEKIQADKEKIDAEFKVLKENYKDVDDVQGRAYIENILTNEAVFKFLGEQ